MNQLCQLRKFVSMKKTFRSITSRFLGLRISFNQQTKKATWQGLRQCGNKARRTQTNVETHQRAKKAINKQSLTLCNKNINKCLVN